MSWVLVVDEKQKGDPGGRRAARLGKPFILPTFPKNPMKIKKFLSIGGGENFSRWIYHWAKL